MVFYQNIYNMCVLLWIQLSLKFYELSTFVRPIDNKHVTNQCLVLMHIATLINYAENIRRMQGPHATLPVSNTVGCRNESVQCFKIIQELRRNINQMLDPQRHPIHIGWATSFGCRFVNICENIDSIITTPHNIKERARTGPWNTYYPEQIYKYTRVVQSSELISANFHTISAIVYCYYCHFNLVSTNIEYISGAMFYWK